MGKDGRRQKLKSADEGRVDELERKLKFHFRHRDRALTALTHSSFRHETRENLSDAIEDNERLEFLGDAVVDLAVGLRLMERHPDLAEGSLSRMRSEIVDERGLARIARKMGLGSLLRLGFGEKKSGGADKPSVISDAMEAVLAAVFLDGGLDAVLAIVDREFETLFDEAFSGAADVDFKAMLQTWTQAKWKVLPVYEVISEDGPSHAKVFCTQVLVDGIVRGEGAAHSKKEATRLAAKATIEAFEKETGEVILPRRSMKPTQSEEQSNALEGESTEGGGLATRKLLLSKAKSSSNKAGDSSAEAIQSFERSGLMMRKKPEGFVGTAKRQHETRPFEKSSQSRRRLDESSRTLSVGPKRNSRKPKGKKL